MSLVPPDRSGAYADIAAVVRPLAERFSDAGHRLYLVGGVVRDLLLDRHGAGDDIDCTTDARPDTIKAVLEGAATAMWTQGERFGTIGATVGGRALEITTHRAESYDAESRKPTVSFGDDLEVDLSRRDFTINAMAIDALDGSLHDPFGGRADLAARRLVTPLDPHVAFDDDPLRMLRAARFVPRFDLDVDPSLAAAVRELADRLGIVSVERCHDEFERLLDLATPLSGLRFAADTGLLDRLLPGFDAVRDRATIDVAGAVDLEIALDARARRTALLSPPAARDALQHLRYSTAERAATLSMLGWLDRLADGRTAGDGELRRLVAECGGDARRVVVLAARLGRADADRLMDRLGELEASGDLDDLGPPVGGGELIEALGLAPGPTVGRLVSRLGEHRLDVGPVDRAEALRLAAEWLAETAGPDDVGALR